MGIKVVIFGVGTPDGILKAIDGKTGTLCLPQPCSMPARRKWLASGSLVTGKIQIDSGAQKALEKRHSLLAVGVKAVLEKFECGEVIEIVNEENAVVAVGRAKVASDAVDRTVQNLEIAHADDIVLL